MSARLRIHATLTMAQRITAAYSQMATTPLTSDQAGFSLIATHAKKSASEGGSQPCWYAVYTNVRHEKQVARQMEGRSLDCFLPLYRSSRRWKDRRKELDLPLFPGYVFVRMSSEDRLRVLSIPSIVHIVSFRGTPAPLPDADIELLRNRLATGARLEPHPYLSVGKRVRVRSGPVAGLEGIVRRRKEKCRVVISIDAIMRSVAVEVDEADIEPVA